MEDISLHILDIAENSLRAGAKNIAITLTEDKANHILKLEIEDDGTGMAEETINHAINPFFSTKDGKKFGLGLSLLCQACDETGGEMSITNRKDKGIKIVATFKTDNIDIKPVGDISKTLRVLRATHPDVDIFFENKTI